MNNNFQAHCIVKFLIFDWTFYSKVIRNFVCMGYKEKVQTIFVHAEIILSRHKVGLCLHAYGHI